MSDKQARRARKAQRGRSVPPVPQELSDQQVLQAIRAEWEQQVRQVARDQVARLVRRALLGPAVRKVRSARREQLDQRALQVAMALKAFQALRVKRGQRVQ